MDLIVYFNFFIFGWICCQFYIAWKIRKALKKVAEENGMTFEELASTFLETKGIEASVIKVPNYFTENNGNSILLYNNDTGDFISQACSIEELAENVYEFKKIKFALVKHNDDHFWFVEGKVRTDLKNI